MILFVDCNACTMIHLNQEHIPSQRGMSMQLCGRLSSNNTVMTGFHTGYF